MTAWALFCHDFDLSKGINILSEKCPVVLDHYTVVVDKGYKGAPVEGVRILRSGQRRGITRGLKAKIKRRSAIEPTIGHMKSDGKLSRNWLKGQLGDAVHAILCGAGHNIRLLLRHLRYFLVLIWVLNLCFGDSKKAGYINMQSSHRV